jgi:hypothetical protein
VLFCLKPKQPWSTQSLTRLAGEFSASGNLTAFGTFQGLYVRATESQTALLSVEVLDGLSLRAMFPDHGDAPGNDMTDLPRPLGTRALSVSFRGQATVTAYKAAAPPDQALDSFLSALKSLGAQINEVPRADKGALRGAGVKPPQAALARTDTGSFLVQAYNLPSTKSGVQSLLLIGRLPK